MHAMDLNDDDGFVEMTVRGPDGETVTKRMDLYEAHNVIFELGQRYRSKTANEYHTALVEAIKGLGFPTLSHRAASRFSVAIVQRVNDLGNADTGAPMPGSPGSTGPGPSALPTPTS